jgi:hypothetical protein
MLDAIGSWPGAIWLQHSGTAYLFVNAAHILGIGMLLGSILPLDLRLLGFFPRFPIEVLWPFLVRCAAFGLTLAAVTGIWLFSVKPVEYIENEAFRWKLVLLTIALMNVTVQLWRHGRATAPDAVTRIGAALSLLAWLSALVAGRWIGFW